MTNEQIKESLRQSIKDSYKDFAVFHFGTFEIEELDKYKETGDESNLEIGKIIDDYMQSINMTKEEDACYIAGKLDAYKELIKLLNK